MALLRACGIPCRIHGFTIDKILQKGAMTGLVYKFAPDEIFHSYVEAYVCGEWYNLEGFILDKKYLSALQKIFKPNNDGSFTGYGVATKNFINPSVEFNCCNTYIQKEGIVRDFGVYDDPDSGTVSEGQLRHRGPWRDNGGYHAEHSADYHCLHVLPEIYYQGCCGWRRQGIK